MAVCSFECLQRQKADRRAKEARDDGKKQIAAQRKLAMTDSMQIAAQRRLAMTDSRETAIPCFAGTGAKEARDDEYRRQ